MLRSVRIPPLPENRFRKLGFDNRDLYWSISPVANEQGSFTTPSFVSFTDKERLIGESAKNNAAMNPKNTIFDIKSVSRLSRRQQGINESTGVWSEEDSMTPTPQRYLHDFISSRLSCIEIFWILQQKFFNFLPDALYQLAATNTSSRIFNHGLSPLLTRMDPHSFKLSISERRRPSPHKRSHLWFWPRQVFHTPLLSSEFANNTWITDEGNRRG